MAVGQKQNSFRYVVLLFLFRRTVEFSRLLPVAFAIRLGHGIGYVVGLLSKRELRIAVAQIDFVRRVVPEAFHENSRKIALKSFAHIGECITEIFLFSRMLECSPDKDGSVIPHFAHIRATGADLCGELVRNKKPCLAISGHIGNFELLAAYHAKCGLRVTTIGREPNYSELSRFIDELRTGYGAESIWRHGRAAASVILKALRNGRSLAVLLDQDTALESVYVPFFTIPAAYPRAVVDLAVRNRLRIVSTFIVRESLLQHHVITEEIVYNPDSPNVVAEIFEVYGKRLEAQIAKHAHQWIWWHRRWRRRPEVDYKADPSALRGTTQYISWLKDEENKLSEGTL